MPDLEARTLFASLGVRYPLIRRQNAESVDRRRVRLRQPEGRFLRAADRATGCAIGFLRANWDAIDLRSRRPKWRAAATVELRQGFDIFDASERCSSLGCAIGEPGPSRFDGRADRDADPRRRQCRAGDRRQFQHRGVAARCKRRSTPLLSFEEYTAGNYTIGRGYDPAIVSGDSGAGVAVELRGPRINAGQATHDRVPALSVRRRRLGVEPQ